MREHYFCKNKNRDWRELATKAAEKRCSSRNERIKRAYISPILLEQEINVKKIQLMKNWQYMPDMPEFHTELHAGAFSDRITEEIKERGVGPVFIGNSIVNMIMLSHCLKDFDGEKFSFAVGGDNFVVFFKENIGKEAFKFLEEKRKIIIGKLV